MPVYSYECPECLTRFDVFLRLKEYNKPQECSCGTTANRRIMAPAVRGDYAGYSCPVTGAWIEGRRAHEENLKKHGCRVLESGETQGVVKYHEREDMELEKAVDETAERFVASLPVEKKEKLASEMEAGLTATVVRQ